eukprot:g2024.t1
MVKGRRSDGEDSGTSAGGVVPTFITASLSGGVSALLLQPMDLVKTRQQAQWKTSTVKRSATPNALSLALSIIREEGFSALWKGTTPSLVRICLGVGVYFSSLEGLQGVGRRISKDSSDFTVNFFAGAAARAVAATLLLPITVIKTKMEGPPSTTPFRGLLGVLRNTPRAHLFSGLRYTLLRDVPFSGLYVMFYESLRGDFSPLVSGLMAGASATLITHPFDVLKTRVQIFSEDVSAAKLYREGALQRGLALRLVKRPVQAALIWALYESMLPKAKAARPD